MPAPGTLEALQPALLDRLTDLEPDQAREPRDRRIIGKHALRAAVLRDLAWLFNSTRPSDIDWSGRLQARRSVLNFGLPALSGTTASALDVPALEASIRRAIVDYEPRIVAGSLRVTALSSDLSVAHHNVIAIQITGLLWAQPAPLELLLRTALDLETGQVSIEDLAR